MSIQAVAAAIELQGLPPATKLVLMLLANRHNGDTGLCYPKQETLAAEAGMSVRSLRTHIIELEKAGLICRAVFRLGNGNADQTHYTFPFLERQNLPPKDVDRKKPAGRPANTGELDRQTVSGPIEDKPEENRKKPEDILELAFQTIWKSWSETGKKRSKSKALCKQSLARAAKQHDLRELTKAALRYAKSTEGSFHKGLHTWIAGGFYENYMAKPAARVEQMGETLTDLERAFQSLAETGEWMGDRIGHPIHPNRPDADYPAELYRRFELNRQGEAA